jgi:hypothetical protein
MRHHIKVGLAVLFCILFLSGYAWSQTRKASEPQVLGESGGIDGTDCESTKAYMDNVVIEAGGDKSIIIIARLGNGERSNKVIRRRLHNLNGYLVETRGVSKERVITAEGERVRGLGQVEVYVGGKLFIIFKMKRNGDFFDKCSDG